VCALACAVKIIVPKKFFIIQKVKLFLVHKSYHKITVFQFQFLLTQAELDIFKD
jgi:hypothetical protein